MKKDTQQPCSWSLWNRDITVATGTLIEYQDMRQVRVARVEQVRVVSGVYSPDRQVIDVKLYGSLTKRDGQRARTVQPEDVLRVLDAPPPPAPKALTSLWSPRDSENPFRVETICSNEAWREVARWYPFSVRRLIGNTWQEQTRTASWDKAKEAMNTLAELHYDPHNYCWVVMKCELRGKEGREKPVQWYPSQWNVEEALRKANTP